MLASLPQYQEMREKVRPDRFSFLRRAKSRLETDELITSSFFVLQFSLHLSMAQSCMDLFETKKLSDTGMVEQVSLPSLFFFLFLPRLRLELTTPSLRFFDLRTVLQELHRRGRPQSLWSTIWFLCWGTTRRSLRSFNIPLFFLSSVSIRDAHAFVLLLCLL